MTNIKATVMSLLWATLCCGAALAKHYTPQWAVHIEGGAEVADNIADKHGFINRGEIFTDMYHFEHRAVVRRSIEPSQEHHERLTSEPQVRWARQQVVKSRKKRDYMTLRPRTVRNLLNDPRWPQMWYLNRGNGLDMNVQPAWSEGVTGRGVVVTILDDGLEKDHPDLLQNYDPQASYDVNNHDEDPAPRYDLIDSNRHGTRCAGEVAAVANNSICAVGIAFGASIGGVRMLDGDVTDAVEARSLSLNPQHIDIYSASWGPDDDGKTVDGPGELATRAFSEGVTKGRGGKGSIFIWASGNGGRDHDNCNCDGYTNSIWTLSISSATENGLVPWYSEACSSTLATTYSSGAAGERQVVTTDLHHQCTTSHTGTSASAPLAAGICALALEANPNLTWRDMQHIVVRTARPQNLVSPDWKVNSVGRNVSHSFGYGLMDAAAMVRLARKWRTVPEQHKCEVSAPRVDKLIPAKSQVVLQLTVKECPGVNFLEHVQAKMTLNANRRGDIQIHLTSPAGTRSTLLARRPHDISRAGFQNWPFMTVHTWGEQPFGTWLLEIHNEGRYLGRATLSEWSLLFYGTVESLDGKSQNTTTYHQSPSSLPVPQRPPQRTSTNPQKSIPGERRKKVNPNRGRNKGTSTTLPPSSNFRPASKTPSSRGPSQGRTTAAPRNPARTSTSVPRVSSSRTTPPRVEILYPANPLQFFPNNPSPSLLPNMTFLPQATSKPGVQFPKVLLYPTYPRPKEGRQGNKRPDSPYYTSPFRPVNMLPNKGIDVRQDQFDSRLVAVAGKANITGWKLILHGTETLPGSSDEEGGDVGIILGPPQIPDVSNNISTRYSSTSVKPKSKQPVTPVKVPEIGSIRIWPEEPRQHNGVERTTTEDASSGTGCVVLARSGHQCIECEEMLFLFEGGCVRQCPPRTHVGLSPKGRSACLRCHYSCLACTGQNIDQCLACSPDASLQSTGLCLPLAIDPLLQASRWYFWMFVAFSLNLGILSVFVCYNVLVWLRQCQGKHHYHIVQQEAGVLPMSKVNYMSDSSDDEH